MWCGRFSSPQLEHSFGFAAVSESWERRLLRRDLDTLFCWTAISGAFVFGALVRRSAAAGRVSFQLPYGRVVRLGKCRSVVQRYFTGEPQNTAQLYQCKPDFAKLRLGQPPLAVSIVFQLLFERGQSGKGAGLFVGHGRFARLGHASCGRLAVFFARVLRDRQRQRFLHNNSRIDPSAQRLNAVILGYFGLRRVDVYVIAYKCPHDVNVDARDHRLQRSDAGLGNGSAKAPFELPVAVAHGLQAALEREFAQPAEVERLYQRGHRGGIGAQ